MGVNSGRQQLPAPVVASMNPQQLAQMQQLQALRNQAMTPYQGTAAGGGTAQGVSQLAAALLARRRQQALLAGNPAGAQQPLPVQPAAIDPNGAGGMQGPVPLGPQQ